MFIIILFFIASSINLVAQVDSLKKMLSSINGIDRVNLLNNLAEIDSIKKEERLNYSLEALTLAKELNYGDGKAAALYNLGIAYYDHNEFRDALTPLFEAKELYKGRNTQLKLSDCLTAIGNTYTKLGRHDSAIVYHEQALNIVKLRGSRLDEANALTKIGLINWRAGRFNVALENFNNALKIRQAEKDSEAISSSLNNIGSVFWKKGNYFEAINYFTESQYVRIRIGDSLGLTTSFSNIGTIYQKLNYYEKAAKNFDKAYRISKSHNYAFGKSYALYNFGLLHLEEGEYEKSLDYLNESLSISDKIPEYNLMAMTMNYIGENYENMKNYEEAEKFFMQALTLGESVNDNYVIAVSQQNLARIETLIGRFEEALKLIPRSMRIAQRENLREIIKDNYHLLYKIHTGLYNDYEALENFKSYAELRDSIFNEQLVNNVANLMIRFEIEQTETENKLLKKQKELDEAEIQNQKNLFTYATIIALLAIGIGTVLFLLYRYKANSSQKIEQQKQQLEILISRLDQQNKELKEMNESKAKLFSIIAHDLRNPLGVIFGYLDILKKENETLTKEEKQEYTQIALTLTESLLELVQNFFEWARSQIHTISANLSCFDASETVDSAIDFYSSIASFKNIELTRKMEAEGKVKADKNMINTVLRNLISNAIKFTKPSGKVIVRVTRDNSKLKFCVEDTGIGVDSKSIKSIFDENLISREGTNKERGTGFGLRLCKEFVKKNGGEIGVESTPNVGSKFWFTVPEDKEYAS